MAHSRSHEINHKNKKPNIKYNQQEREQDIHLINNKNFAR